MFARDALKHLVHPDTYEAVASQQHKRKILRVLGGVPVGKSTDMDRELEARRFKMEGDGTAPVGFTFYDAAVRPFWLPTPAAGTTVGVDPDQDDADAPIRPAQLGLAGLAVEAEGLILAPRALSSHGRPRSAEASSRTPVPVDAGERCSQIRSRSSATTACRSQAGWFTSRSGHRRRTRRRPRPDQGLGPASGRSATYAATYRAASMNNAGPSGRRRVRARSLPTRSSARSRSARGSSGDRFPDQFPVAVRVGGDDVDEGEAAHERERQVEQQRPVQDVGRGDDPPPGLDDVAPVGRVGGDGDRADPDRAPVLLQREDDGLPGQDREQRAERPVGVRALHLVQDKPSVRVYGLQHDTRGELQRPVRQWPQAAYGLVRRPVGGRCRQDVAVAPSSVDGETRDELREGGLRGAGAPVRMTC
jgi:hypothetical protein